MLIFRNESTSPSFNLAAEEYLTDVFPTLGTESVFMLWRNGPSVIIGKNQNAYAEVDSKFTSERNIPVIRRMTGGGAVFHDLGNVNYSFVSFAEEKNVLNYHAFCTPIIKALALLGLEAELSGRNDILIDSKKVSGNAQCVKNNVILHHGTLLWNADFSDMAGALRPDPDKLKAKGIKSVSSRVANISSLLPSDAPLNPGDSADRFLRFIESAFDGEIRTFSESDIEKIRGIEKERYSNWEWNWGKSPEFSVEKKIRFPYGTVSCSLNVEHGLIKQIKFCGDFFGVRDVSVLEASLAGARYELSVIEEKLSDIALYINGAAPHEIADLILN